MDSQDFFLANIRKHRREYLAKKRLIKKMNILEVEKRFGAGSCDKVKVGPSPSYCHRANYRDRFNVKSFIDKFGLGRGNTAFFTVTFRENIISKKESSRLLNNLLSGIRREFCSKFYYFSIAERQKRGAWHYHFIITLGKGAILEPFKKYVQNFISNSSESFGFFKVRWTYGKDANALAWYMSKYLTKQKRESGVRYVNFSRNLDFNKISSCGWSFVGGGSQIWRNRCKLLYSSLGPLFSSFYNHAPFDAKYMALFVLWRDDGEYGFLDFSPQDYILSWLNRKGDVIVQSSLDLYCYGRLNYNQEV